MIQERGINCGDVFRVVLVGWDEDISGDIALF